MFNSTAMELRYDDDFLEAAVSLCTSGRRRGVPALQIRRFHAARERCYEFLDPDERNAAFARVHLDWFREWGLEKPLLTVVAEFPLLEPALDVLAFRQSRSRKDEGAELYVSSGSGNRQPFAPPFPEGFPITSEKPIRNAVAALRIERLENDEVLARWLRREFAHLSDMVDPRFNYSPQIQPGGREPTPHRLVRERYRVLWDITIDARLERAGRAPGTRREQHATSFDATYSFRPEEWRKQVFEELWTSSEPRHDRLLELASDPRNLGLGHEPGPGLACPLCGFPTYEWARAEALAPATVNSIRSDFADWNPSWGVCHRCVESYQAIAPSEWPPTICR